MEQLEGAEVVDLLVLATGLKRASTLVEAAIKRSS